MNCPRNKAHDQSSEATTIAMMVVDENDVLLAVSADEESDWISDLGNAYHLCRDRKVFSTDVACEGLVRMANNMTKSCWQRNSLVPHGRREIHEVSGGTLRVFKGNKKCCRRRKTGALYRLEGSVQTGGAIVRHGSSDISKKNGRGKQPLHRGTQSKRQNTRKIYSKDPEWYRSAKRSFGIRAEVWPNTRKKKKWITTTCKLTYFAAHPVGGAGHLSKKVQPLQFESAFTLVEVELPVEEGQHISDPVLQILRGSWTRSCRMDNLKTSYDPPMGWRLKSHMEAPSSSIVKNGGMYELSHELIFSSLWPINLEGCLRRRGPEQKCNPWGITGSTQLVTVCRGAESESSVREQRVVSLGLGFSMVL
ncbi:hypothetical protein Acr_18g0008930 [Actinidia rufa]|uniref:Uncharacterized protein n=1 Tax=Actinidia rufa TaxID=165716 RepID=A0A7J0G7F6_9ERIC|nr:hypothetical protein Acr_18g0008930 [Actinidia rufa]